MKGRWKRHELNITGELKCRQRQAESSPTVSWSVADRDAQLADRWAEMNLNGDASASRSASWDEAQRRHFSSPIVTLKCRCWAPACRWNQRRRFSSLIVTLSSPIGELRWSTTATLQLNDRNAEATPLSFSSPMKLNNDALAHRSQRWSVTVEIHQRQLAQWSLSATMGFFGPAWFFFFFYRNAWVEMFWGSWVLYWNLDFKFLEMNFTFVTKDRSFIKIFRDEIHISLLNHIFSDELWFRH